MNELEFYLNREAERLGSDRDLRRAYARGDVVRIAPGMYVPTDRWASLTDDQRHRLQCHAVLTRHQGLQLSHDSAAALWRLPSFGPWPGRVHVTVEQNIARRSTTALIRHEGGIDQAGSVIDGLAVTSLARTVVDVARTTSFIRAVGVADAALRGARASGFQRDAVDRTVLEREVEIIAGRPGSARAARVVEFADARADRLGESICRAQFHALGLPRPHLQRAFTDRQGRIIPDFYFEEWDLALEFDGVGKYLRGREFHPELTEAQIVVKEKRRENRLRRLVRDVARVEWAESIDRRKLVTVLREHNVPV